jgi:diguanylate cyclase (GGDEF)-like protein
MRDHVNIDVFINWASMLRADVDGAILVIDDEEEARFYETLIHKSARIVPAFQLAPTLIEELTKTGVQGVVAVLRGVRNTGSVGSNIFCPAIGDAASLLLASTNCERVIADVCGAAWVKAGEKEIGSLLERVVLMTRVFEQIRSEFFQKVGRSLNIEAFVKGLNWSSFELDSDGLRSIFGEHDCSEAALMIESLAPENLNTGLRECDGNDAVYLLAAATNFFAPRGIAANRKVEVGELMGMLRAGFQLEEIENDDMFWGMKKWERDNAKYPLLRDWRTMDPLEVVLDQRYWQTDLVRFLDMLDETAQMAALKMDLDNFKAVNDELGHSAGDEAIRFYCSIVKEIVGTNGYVYRRGGDELVAIIPRIDSSSARETAEKIRRQIESEFCVWAAERGLVVPPTASIGMVVCSRKPSLEVIKLMDEAQKRAKTEGKNRVVTLA